MPAACTGLWSTTRRKNSEAVGLILGTHSVVFVAASVEYSIFWRKSVMCFGYRLMYITGLSGL